MSHSYPIWNTVKREPEFAKRLAFGARDSFEQTVLVGTSATNSHELARIEVTRHEAPGGGVTFHLFIDGLVVKRGHLCGKELHVYEIKEGR